MIFGVVVGAVLVVVGLAAITNFAGVGDWSIRQNERTRDSVLQEGFAPTTRRGNRLWGTAAIVFGVAFIVLGITSG